MLDFVVISMVLQNDKKEKEKSKQLIEMKQKGMKEKGMKEKGMTGTNKNSCVSCGQYLPWFCMCYLNPQKKYK